MTSNPAPPAGVIGGIAALRALKEAGFVPRRPLEAMAFTSEEPTRFGLSCSGSRAMAGEGCRVGAGWWGGAGWGGASCTQFCAIARRCSTTSGPTQALQSCSGEVQHGICRASLCRASLHALTIAHAAPAALTPPWPLLQACWMAPSWMASATRTAPPTWMRRGKAALLALLAAGAPFGRGPTPHGLLGGDGCCCRLPCWQQPSSF